VCCSVLQCVAVCCSVLQCVAVCCIVLQCVAVCCSVLQCVVMCGRVWQCVAVCCIVLQCVAEGGSELQCVAVCCSVVQCGKVQQTCARARARSVSKAARQHTLHDSRQCRVWVLLWHLCVVGAVGLVEIVGVLPCVEGVLQCVLQCVLEACPSLTAQGKITHE